MTIGILNPAFIGRLRGGGFNPASLPGYACGFDANGPLYTDTARTTRLITNGQTVGGAPDPSGNSRHWSQATAGNRPEYVQTGGRGSLVFRSSAKTLVTPSFLDSSFDTAWTQYWVIEPGNTNTFCLANGFNSLAMYLAPLPSAGVTKIRVNTQNLSNQALDTTYADGNKLIIAARYNGSAKKAIIRTAADVYSQDVAATGNCGFSGPVYLGDLSAGGFPFIGRVYESHLYSAAHSDGEVTAMLDDLAGAHLKDPPAGGLATGVGTKIVVCTGNSLTASTYPATLAGLLGAGWTVHTVATSGITTAALNLAAELEVDTLFDPTAERCVCVPWELTNDYYFGAPAGVAIRRCLDWFNRRRHRGFELITPLTLSRSGGSTPGDFNTSRGLGNGVITAYAGSGRSRVPTFPPAMMVDGAESNLTYFTGDSTHLNSTGYAAVASAVRDELLP